VSRTAWLALTTFLAMSACQQPQALEPAAKRPTPPPEPTAAVSPPIGEFAAISNTAMSLTGDVVGSAAGELRFERGQVYGLGGGAEARGGDRFAASGATWSSLLGVAEQRTLRIFRVTDEGPASRRGLCGSEPATFLAAAEGRDPGGAPALFLAVFKGDHPPGPQADEASLCGTFMYAPKPAVAESSKK
jgi:hypothetical protein